jgi:hypothetical protein
VELQKPTVGFQARFFGERANPRKILSLNGFRGQKSQKHEKTRKKMVFLKRGPPVFLPNAPKNGSLFLSVRFIGRGQGRLWP